MKHSIFKVMTAAACIALLCASLVGCNKNEAAEQNGNGQPKGSQNNTVATTQVPRPDNAPLVTPDDTCPLIGTWSVESTGAPLTAITFNKDGTAMMTLSTSPTTPKPAVFTVDGDAVTLSASGMSIVGAFAVDGDTATINTNTGDIMTLTKQ